MILLPCSVLFYSGRYQSCDRKRSRTVTDEDTADIPSSPRYISNKGLDPQALALVGGATRIPSVWELE